MCVCVCACVCYIDNSVRPILKSCLLTFIITGNTLTPESPVHSGHISVRNDDQEIDDQAPPFPITEDWEDSGEFSYTHAHTSSLRYQHS